MRMHYDQGQCSRKRIAGSVFCRQHQNHRYGANYDDQGNRVPRYEDGKENP
jgi:hypothetical protein